MLGPKQFTISKRVVRIGISGNIAFKLKNKETEVE
jgi:hypothetical protein